MPSVHVPIRTSALSLAASPSKDNEDFCFVADGFAVLLDGATGLLGREPLSHGYASDAAWLSHRFGQMLSAALSRDRHSNVVKLLRYVAEKLRQEWICLGGEMGESLALPSATLDIAVWDADTVNIFSVGDSPAVVLLKDSSFEAPVSEGLRQLSRENAAALLSAMEMAGGDPAKARELSQEAFRASRAKKNTPCGYWIADISQDWQSHVEHREYPLEKVESVLLASDGFACAVEYGLCADLGELARSCALGQGERMAGEIRLLEEEDVLLKCFLRTKIHDDCSFASILF